MSWGIVRGMFGEGMNVPGEMSVGDMFRGTSGCPCRITSLYVQ